MVVESATMMESGWPFGVRPTPQRVCSLWKSGRLMQCEINDVRDSSNESLGHEVQVYVRGDFHYSRLHPIAEAADADAESIRRESVAAGWAERPPKPD